MAKHINNKPQRGNAKGGRGGKPRPSSEGPVRNSDSRPAKQAGEGAGKSNERRYETRINTLGLSDQKAISKKTATTRLLKPRRALNTSTCRRSARTTSPATALRSLLTRSRSTKEKNSARAPLSPRTPPLRRKRWIAKWRITGSSPATRLS